MCAVWSQSAFHPLLAALPELAGIYLFCLIVGGGLLFISTVLGGHHDADVDTGGLDSSGLDTGDLDMGADLSADADLDGGVDFDTDAAHATEATVHTAEADAIDHHEAGAFELSKWLSMRFFVYFAAMFGLVGTVLTYMTDVHPGWTLSIALVAGVAMGQLVHQMIRALQRSGVSSEVRIDDLVNKAARVTIAVHPPARGEVGVHVGNREIFLAAVAQRPDDRFETGEQVMITRYASGMAEVISRKEYEFTHDGNTKGGRQ